MNTNRHHAHKNTPRTPAYRTRRKQNNNSGLGGFPNAFDCDSNLGKDEKAQLLQSFANFAIDMLGTFASNANRNGKKRRHTGQAVTQPAASNDTTCITKTNKSALAVRKQRTFRNELRNRTTAKSQRQTACRPHDRLTPHHYHTLHHNHPHTPTHTRSPGRQPYGNGNQVAIDHSTNV